MRDCEHNVITCWDRLQDFGLSWVRVSRYAWSIERGPTATVAVRPRFYGGSPSSRTAETIAANQDQIHEGPEPTEGRRRAFHCLSEAIAFMVCNGKHAPACEA
jgi:hypothetical protein